MATNNALNVPQDTGEILIGITDNAPLSAQITGSGGINVLNGPGTIDISQSLAGLSYVRVPGTGFPITLQRDTIYYGDLQGVGQLYTLPNPAVAGAVFYILCANTNPSPNAGFAIQIAPGSSQQIYYTATTPGTFIGISATPTVASIMLVCVDAPSAGSEVFQVCGTPIGTFNIV